MSTERIKEAIKQSITVKELLLHDQVLMDSIKKTVELCCKTYHCGGQVFFCGNGGSAADAQHLAAELSGRFYFDRPPLNAEALHVNTSYLTAVANDYDFDMIFSRMIMAKGKKNDVLIGISTSGNSKNVLKAFETAKKLGIYNIAMTGNQGGKMREYADVLLNVPSNDTPRIQESHILIGHIICELIEKQMFKNE